MMHYQSGDISDIGKRRGIIDDLLLFLIDVQDKWFEIGVLLGVPVSKLEVIDKGQFSSEDKLRKLIEVMSYIYYRLH